jgi:hypothetical protein
MDIEMSYMARDEHVHIAVHIETHRAVGGGGGGEEGER